MHDSIPQFLSVKSQCRLVLLLLNKVLFYYESCLKIAWEIWTTGIAILAKVDGRLVQQMMVGKFQIALQMD
jgi:hypothetical protein